MIIIIKVVLVGAEVTNVLIVKPTTSLKFVFNNSVYLLVFSDIYHSCLGNVKQIVNS